ncbi:hypothetical protein EST38_g8384 [Candolleomyces aberdarensis]|uniref:Uncharacterized protein n=1 Tax=Candolleomyces aberdarensis TaxID=2316362 RepID=A0A4Q2DCL8_9AGAR|nr:hypothetical protein EST38_g8384 [Candolleomyces aberdarensis]
MISSDSPPENQLDNDPLARITENNFPPTLEESQLASQKLKDIDAELKELQDEMEALPTRLSRLQLRYKILETKREDLSVILSPWRKLPPEIVADILQAAVNPGWDDYFVSAIYSTNRRLFKNLRAVCRMWREVAFSTPSLWTNVWIDFDEYRPEQVADAVRGVQKYFERAGPTLPLQLGFKWRKKSNPISDTWLEYLLSQRSRLMELTVKTTTSHFRVFEERSKAADGATWETRYLNVKLRGGTALATSDAIDASFPVLESIHISSDSDESCHLALLAGHPSLAKLHINMARINHDRFFSKLGGFKHIHELVLTTCAFRSISNDAPSCELPDLQYLTIRDPCSFIILSKIRAPSLTDLQIVTSAHGTPSVQQQLWTTFPQLISFLHETGPKIQDFYLRCWFMQDDDALRRLLEALPAVRRLCLDTWFTDDAESTSKDDDRARSISDQSLLPNVREICQHMPQELRLIGSNDPPTLEEYELASQTFQDIDLELKGLEDGLMELQRRLPQLQSRHTATAPSKRNEMTDSPDPFAVAEATP